MQYNDRMTPLKEHVKNYHDYHETRFTKYTHAVAIPMLILSLLIFFSWLRIDFATHWQIDIAWLIVFGIVIYYCVLHFGLGLIMAVLLGLLSWLADWIAGAKPDALSITIFLILFIVSNFFILYGHHHERHHANVKKNLYHLSIAPLLLLIDLLTSLGIKLKSIG